RARPDSSGVFLRYARTGVDRRLSRSLHARRLRPRLQSGTAGEGPHRRTTAVLHPGKREENVALLRCANLPLRSVRPGIPDRPDGATDLKPPALTPSSFS